LNARKRLAHNIRALRAERGLSQEAFADIIGLHRTFMGSVERSERNVSLDNIEKIAKGFGVDIQRLFDMPKKS
jgi:transcriptional regulator with XRE-family HTH domain